MGARSEGPGAVRGTRRGQRMGSGQRDGAWSERWGVVSGTGCGHRGETACGVPTGSQPSAPLTVDLLLSLTVSGEEEAAPSGSSGDGWLRLAPGHLANRPFTANLRCFEWSFCSTTFEFFYNDWSYSFFIRFLASRLAKS